MKLMPYGELWRNQRNATYRSRYTFSGKERDEETGYDFFGARNYSSAITTWLSPDPLLDKYPSISSYAHCNWNPLKYVDPDGRGPNDRTNLRQMTEKVQKYLHIF